MKYWRYVEPTSATDPTPVEHMISDAEIIANYYPYWKGRMRKAGKAQQISEENCITDWTVVHWAVPVDEATLPIEEQAK